MTKTMLTTIPAGDLPYPQTGLVREGRCPNLKNDLQKLLGDGFNDPATNRQWFPTDAYRTVVLHHLCELFNQPSLREVNKQAISVARKLTAFNTWVDEAEIPEELDRHLPLATRACTDPDVAKHVPTFIWDGIKLWPGDDQPWDYCDGTHRGVFLRMVLPPSEPVLVRLQQ